MNSSSTDSWSLVNASRPVLASAASTSPTSLTSPTEGYLQRLAHFDEGLYSDFYSLWIALVVVNSFIFLVGISPRVHRGCCQLPRGTVTHLYRLRPQVGTVLNTVALYVFCFRTKPKTTSIIYTINLAVTDLLVNLSLPTRILLYYSGGACLTCSYLHTFSYFVNMYCSILFLTCICVDRYLAIVQVGRLGLGLGPQPPSDILLTCFFFLLQVEASRRWRSSSVAKCVCVSVWLFAIVVTYSFLSTAFQHTGCCLSKLLFLTVTEFFLPLIVIVVFTVRIMWALADPRLMQQSR